MPVMYGIFYCGPTRSALLTAKLIGLDLTFKIIDLKKLEHKGEEYTKICPAQTVPTFEDDNGFRIFDSHAIVTYLVSKYAKDDALYPKDLEKRAIVDSMLHFNNASLLPAIAGHLGRTRLQGKAVDPEREELLHARLRSLNRILEERKFAAGETLTVADACLANVVSYAGACDMDLGSYPHIVRWEKELKRSMPFYEEVVQAGADAVRANILENDQKMKNK